MRRAHVCQQHAHQRARQRVGDRLRPNRRVAGRERQGPGTPGIISACARATPPPCHTAYAAAMRASLGSRFSATSAEKLASMAAPTAAGPMSSALNLSSAASSVAATALGSTDISMAAFWRLAGGRAAADVLAWAFGARQLLHRRVELGTPFSSAAAAAECGVEWGRCVQPPALAAAAAALQPAGPAAVALLLLLLQCRTAWMLGGWVSPVHQGGVAAARPSPHLELQVRAVAARGGSADAGRAGWLPEGADSAAAALYLFSPLCAGVVRAGGRVAEAACGWLTGDVCRHGREAQRWWVRPHLPHPPVPMRLQVLEQHLVVEALWLAADGVRRCAVMACAHGLSSAAQAGVTAGAALGAAAYVGLHPAALLPAVASQAPAGRRAAVVAGFVAAVMALVAASAAACGGWGWLDRVYGAMVRADDLTPNVGLWWYLMIEVFAPFRLLNLRVLHGVLWLMAPPIAVAHRGNAPLVSAVVAVAAAMAGGGLNALARPDGRSAARHRGPAEALPDGCRLWAHRGLPSCG